MLQEQDARWSKTIVMRVRPSRYESWANSGGMQEKAGTGPQAHKEPVDQDNARVNASRPAYFVNWCTCRIDRKTR